MTIAEAMILIEILENNENLKPIPIEEKYDHTINRSR